MSKFHKLYLIIGPSGTGKSTLARGLTQAGVPEIISHTSRPRRVGEVEHVNYHYVTPNRFCELVNSGEMIEHVTYNGHSYGVSRSSVENVITHVPGCLVIEPHGALQVRERYPDETVAIFLAPSANEVLRARMLARGDDPSVVEQRIGMIHGEVGRALVENPDLVDYIVDSWLDASAVLERVLRIIRK